MSDRILFVCSGNTCRSPLAAALAARWAAAHGFDLVAESAGVQADEDAPASAGALAVAREAGLDLSQHHARLLTRPLVLSAQLVLAMGARQREFIAVLAPEVMDRTHRLRDYAGAGPSDVSDPYGRDLVVYRRTLQELEDLVHRSLQRWSDRDAREREGPSEPGRLE